jgi:uncharacterized membrane protein
VNCEPQRDQARLERTIGRILGWGTLASSVCLAVGLVMALAGVAGGAARLLAEAGLLVLIATPAGRVIVSVVEYIRERDWLFTTLTLIVLAALGGSVIAAFWF